MPSKTTSKTPPKNVKIDKRIGSVKGPKDYMKSEGAGKFKSPKVGSSKRGQ